jgi:phenylalanyl-tRNA synthetase beta chain
MRAPLSWLRDFAPFDLDPLELGRVFDDLGMVVEGIERVGEGLEGIVLGRVLEVAPIPKARVQRTRVDLGDEHGRDVQIVCGGPNVAAGQLVPVAVVGATLPNGMAIGQRMVLGVESNGMICSAVEVGVGEDSAGIMVLDDDLGEPGDPFAKAMGIDVDVVYDLAIETNRPDANCIAGIARDAAARLGLPFSLPAVPPLASELPAPAAVPVITCPELAPRFGVAVLEGGSVGPSPAWLARRLTLAGMRPISNLVDISNYVMLELGQPTHPYDLDRLPGGSLGVRAAEVGEVLTTLDDVERSLGGGPSPDVLITDAEGTPVGIAGIMGGASSEVHDGTTRVLLEAAHFDRLTVAKTSKRLALRSEASARFERGVDPCGIELAIARYAQLAGEAAGARVTAVAVVESADHVPPRPPIRVRTERVNGLLGTDLDDDRIAGLLGPIGFQAELVEPGVHRVIPPSFRLDAEQEADVIEEVARHLSYSSIERTVPSSPLVGGLTAHQRARRHVREVLVGLGCTEAATGLLLGPGDHVRAGLAALEEGALRAVDPLAREESILRRSLRPGLLRAVAFNLDRRQDRVHLFEIGTVFHPADGTRPVERVDAERWLPDEPEVVTVVLAGGGADATTAVRIWRALADALRLASTSLAATDEPAGLHPTRTAAVTGADRSSLGAVGEIDPDVLAGLGIAGRVGVLELDLRLLLAEPRRSDEALPVSRFPSSEIDLAFAVPEPVPAEAVEATLRSGAGALLERISLFDAYRGTGLVEGTRSLAFRLRFTAPDRTLTDADVASVRQACIDAVTGAHGATLR